MNGSSSTGNCSNVSMASTMTTCLQPTSSVLFDGHVPTLTGLDLDWLDVSDKRVNLVK